MSKVMTDLALTDEGLAALLCRWAATGQVVSDDALRIKATLESRDAALAVVVEHLHAVCCAIEDRVQAPITETFFDVLGPARYAITDLPASAQALLAERDEAKAIVADCNNELFGSHGYFKEASGVTARAAIGKLKVQCNAEWRRAETAEAKVVALEKLVHVPGQWCCAKCKFVVQKMVMNANTGDVGLRADTKTEPCPNGCGPLWPVTWKDDAFECGARLEQQHERIATLERSVSELEEQVSLVRAECDVMQTNQRTPGMVEVCSECGDKGKDGFWAAQLGNIEMLPSRAEGCISGACPIAALKPGKDEGV